MIISKSFLNNHSAVLEWIQSHIPNNTELSLDTETDGLHYNCKLKGISLCTDTDAVYINLNDNPDFDLIIAELLNAICGRVELLIMHNAPFDLRVLKSVCIDYRGEIFDTAVAAHLLNENASCALKKLAARVLKIPQTEIFEYKDAIKFGLDSERFKNYAINDAIWTRQLYEIEKPLLFKQGLDKLFYCAVKGTKVLTTNLQYVPVETLKIGDKLVACEEGKEWGHKLCEATVTANKAILRNCIKVRTKNREVVVSREHPFLVERKINSTWYPFIEANKLRIGDKILAFPMWDSGDSNNYVAGFLDGEGSVGTRVVQWASTDKELLNAVRDLVHKRGFATTLCTSRKATEKWKEAYTEIVTGGAMESMRFLGGFRPQRLLRNNKKIWDKMTTGGLLREEVMSLEDVGEQEVIGLSTDKHTYTVEGLLCHNSIEMPFQRVLLDMYDNGILIDTNKLKNFEDTVTAKMQQYQVLAIESAGLKMKEEKDLFGFTVVSSPMNLNSDEQVAKIIEGKFKIKLPRTEPSKTYPNGQPSTASDALEPHKDKCKFIEYLLKFRKADKLLNTFISPMWGHICKDGRIRTSFNDTVARTGRLSSSEPNLQNIPRELSKDDLVNVRELFVAKDGYTFVVADYDSQELRQLANLTGDKNLITAFNKDMDLHLYTAIKCLELPIPDEYACKGHKDYKGVKENYKEERYIGKNGINFPIIYGSTAYGIAKNNKVSKETAQAWLDGFFRTYPHVMGAIKKCRQELFRSHLIKNYFGRRRRFGEVDNGAIRQGFNFLIQSFCADLLRLTLTALRQLYLDNPQWDAKLALTVHDSVVTEVRSEFAKECLEKTKYVMENTINLDVKFLVDIKISGVLE